MSGKTWDWARLRSAVTWRLDRLAADADFLSESIQGVGINSKIRLIKRLHAVTRNVESPHTEREILTFIAHILKLPPSEPGVIVEAGCFKGSSTAKFSLAAALAGRELVVFDSFEGIPSNDEDHGKTIFGDAAYFGAGDYKGSLNEVRDNVTRFGEVSACRFIKGWFEQTMPEFNEPVAAAYIDVDLASSTRTAIKYLYPLLRSGGSLYSQDGHLPLVLEVFDDADFWRNEVGFPKPTTAGFGTEKLIRVNK